MTCPFENPIQTVKDDKGNSCQYKLSLRPYEDLILYAGKRRGELYPRVIDLRFQEFTVCVIFFLFFPLARVQKVVYYL